MGKRDAPQVGQVWRHNARFSIGDLTEEPDAPIYLVLDEARMSWSKWDLTLLNLTTGAVVQGSVRFSNHEDWERVS